MIPTDDRELMPPLRAVFANFYMRRSIFEIGVWDILFAPQGGQHLQGMWQRCAQAFAEDERLPPEGLALRPPLELANWLVLPILFPPPLEIAEAYFGAIAVRPGRRKWFFRRQAPLVRYLLLERGATGPGLGSMRTVLGEWTALTHMNHGDGPEPHLPSFLDGVARILKGEVKLEAVTVVPAHSNAGDGKG
jgi:hypothetical protein